MGECWGLELSYKERQAALLGNKAVIKFDDSSSGRVFPNEKDDEALGRATIEGRTLAYPTNLCAPEMIHVYPGCRITLISLIRL